MNDDRPKVRLINEKDLEGFDGKLPDLPTIYFKIVSVGEKTLTENEHDPARVLAVLQEQPGFFLIGDDQENVCDSMHQIVMKLHEAWTGDKENESEKQAGE